jgi:hypothetical protein
LIVSAGILAALPLAVSTNVVAARPAPTSSASKTVASSREIPFLPLTAKERKAAQSRVLKSGGGAFITRRGMGTAAAPGIVASVSASRSSSTKSKRTGAPLVLSSPPDELAGFAGTAQASTMTAFGGDQEVTPPNEDVAAGPSDVVEVVNSTIEVFSRSGTLLAGGFADLNTFMDVTVGYHSSDPRVIYDASGGRFWLTITEVADDYQPSIDCPASQPVLIAVSGSSNPLPLDDWTVYTLPMATSMQTGAPATEFGDQPGLGISSNTVTVSFDDYDCAEDFTGSEIDILQKTDFENDTYGNGFSLYYFYNGPFAPQPVQALGSMSVAYIVSNQSDCASQCLNGVPDALVQAFTGTPEDSNVVSQPAVYIPMAATAVDANGFLPPADQQQPASGGPAPQLQTNDDRFLNAVWENGEIWTADGTSCEPPGDTVQRDCLNYLEIAADSTASTTPTVTNQVDNVGIVGADLFYPAVSVDAAGDMLTVFDESSTSLDPSIVDAAIPSGGTALTAFVLLHTSPTYYNGNDLFSGACDPVEGCRWGDYSGAAQDPANPKDVWIVSGSADGTIDSPCHTANACWNTHIYDVTVSAPVVTSMTPNSGPMAGGEVVTVRGTDFGSDTTVGWWAGTTLVPTNITPTALTFVTPPAAQSPEIAPMTVIDELGSTVGTTFNFTYVALANYFPVTPYRILNTRDAGSGGPLGPGAIRGVQVTMVGSGTQIPNDATAAVLNVTEVSGSASSLLTVFPYGTARPNASNLNFAAHTVIANLVTVTLTPYNGDEWIDIYNALGTVNVLVDVEGYFTPEAASDVQGLFHPITPVRVCDTRAHSPTPFCTAHGALGQGDSMLINFAITGGLPGDGSAGAAVVNLTAVAGSSFTYLSLFPPVNGTCPYGPGNASPFSAINVPAGVVQANRVMVALGPATSGGVDDAICVYNSLGTINVVIDANGWFGSANAPASPAGYQFQALAPLRICDTRVAGYPCVDGGIGSKAGRLIPVASVADIPAITTSTLVVAVIANLTAITPTAPTYLTAYPGNLTGAPEASDLNVYPGEVLPNLIVVQLDTTGDANDGKVYLYNGAGSVNAIIDIEGWFQ